jgi:ABC-2 type transport system permease protein
MTRWRQNWLLARREFVQRARSRAFLVTMGLLVVSIVGAGLLIAVIGGNEQKIDIGLAGDVPAGIESDITSVADSFGDTVGVNAYDSVAEAEQALEDGDVDVVLEDGAELVWQKEENFQIGQIVQTAVALNERRQVIAELQATPEQIQRLQGTELDSRSLESVAQVDEAKQLAGFLASMVLYISILVFGQFVAIGAVEEKQSRVVEVVLSRVDASQILVGKVVGIGALGLAQLIVLGATTIVTLSIVQTDLPLPSIGLNTALSVVLWFILGYALYAFLYAALGATVSRQEDLQGVLILPVIVILPGFFVAQFALAEPDSPLVRLGSLFPFWTPFVMPVRMGNGDVAVWEVLLSVGLVVATAVLLNRIGARLYSGALLKTGSRVKLREAWKSAGEGAV